MRSSVWQYTKIQRLKQFKSSKNWKIQYDFMACSYNVLDFSDVVMVFPLWRVSGTSFVQVSTYGFLMISGEVEVN